RLSVGGRPVRFKAASADYSQPGHPVAHAIDDDPRSGWAIHPEVGKPHAAVFELDAPLSGDDDSELTVTLAFQSPLGQHQLGRFRLAVTAAPDPRRLAGLPLNVQAALATAPEQRSAAQQAELRAHYRASFSPEFKQQGERLRQLRQARA